MGETVVRFEKFTKRFAEKIVLDQISLDVNKGEILGIMGLSGSGKTTLLNSLIGFYEGEEGDILFNAKSLIGDRIADFKSVQRFKEQARMIFGFATQVSSLYPKLTVYENLDYFGALFQVPKKIRDTNIRKLLEITGLTYAKDLRTENLSEGMKKRLDIACALIHNPKVLILDEPTADLDPIYRKQINQLIKKINKIGTTIVVASHLLDEASEICTRVTIIHNGKLLVIGTPQELIKKHVLFEEVILETTKKIYPEISKQLHARIGKDIEKITLVDGKLHIRVKEGKEALKHIIHILESLKDELVDIRVTKPSLDEVFEILIRGRR
ncbi:MAG: ABC transporter ATP-binding protein [Candidatus Woesearchaeota archaeon]